MRRQQRSPRFARLRQRWSGLRQSKARGDPILRLANDPADLVNFVLETLRRSHARLRLFYQAFQRSPVVSQLAHDASRTRESGGTFCDEAADFRGFFVHLPSSLIGLERASTPEFPVFLYGFE